MYVPSNRELTDNITDKVISIFSEIAFIAPSGSYELRNSLDLVDFFDKIDKTSYGALQSFVKLTFYTSLLEINTQHSKRIQ